VSRWKVIKAADAIGHEDIETDLECIESDCLTGEVYDDWEEP